VSRKENKMSHKARQHPSTPDLVAPLDDEGSAIRTRDSAGSMRPRQESSPLAPDDAPVASTRSPSGSRSVGSRDERLEHKVRLASVLMRNLPPSDMRVRLLNIAIMRRDESLLDGVLAELNKPGSSR
jgi:hypothetical protein